MRGWPATAWAVASSLVLLSGCQREPKRPASPTSDLSPYAAGDSGAARIPKQVIDHLVLRQTSKKGLGWVLRAARGLSYSGDEPIQLERLRIEFHDGREAVRSVLTSREGQIDPKNNALIAEDSVRVVTPDGDLLESDYLRWDPVAERLSTDRAFRFVRGQDIVTGVGFEADPDLKGYTIHQSVRAVMQDARPESLLDE